MQFRVDFSKYLKTQAEIKQNVEWLTKHAATTLTLWAFLTAVYVESALRGLALPAWKNEKRWEQVLDFLTIEPGLVQ